jgi:YceI-like protein
MGWRRPLSPDWYLQKLIPEQQIMLYKNMLCIMLVLFSNTGFSTHHTEFALKKWVVKENSSLSVNGSTNINKFSCVIPAYGQVDTITISKGKDEKGIVLSGSIDLKVNSFDCHNSGMTKQLQKTLGQKQFPLLHIRFLSLDHLPVITAKPQSITGTVDIEIAGVSKRFEINYQISEETDHGISLLGSRELNFSDFNLIPPSKLGGMIKTKDQLTVAFNLSMKTI